MMACVGTYRCRPERCTFVALRGGTFSSSASQPLLLQYFDNSRPPPSMTAGDQLDAIETSESQPQSRSTNRLPLSVDVRTQGAASIQPDR
jgi:hypothetical protein